MSKRNIIEVIDQVRELIPENYEQLHRQLKSVSYTVGYTPPEGMRDRWYEASVALEAALGNELHQPWMQEVNDIWMDK